jgi:flagellar basal body-associated protein FliL
VAAKIPAKDLVKLTASKRLGVFRLWFLILIVLGLLAMLFVGFKVFVIKPNPATNQQQSRSLDSILVPTVYAQPTEQPTQAGQSNQDRSARSRELKQNIMVGIVVVLGLLLLGSFGAVLFAKEPGKVTVAGDILKTVLGFFIGVATTFFGS